MQHAQEKKRHEAPVPAKKPAAVKGADPAQDKARLGAILRPDKAVQDGAALKVGGAQDKAEKDADAVARAVVAPEPATAGKKTDKEDDPTPSARLPFQARGPPLAQETGAAPIRRLADENGNQPDTDSLATVPTMDAKLADVSVAAEEEADFSEISAHDFGEISGGESAVMMKPAVDAPQHVPRVSGDLARRIRVPGGGRPLPQFARARIEARLGVDLGRVRVHTGKDAQLIARHIGARAFAHGPNIWLRSEADLGNLSLLAHEAAHCIQQGAARPLPRPAARPRAPPAMAAVPQARPGPLRRLAAEEPDTGFLARGAESLADRLDSYALLKVLTGRRLFTHETVPQDAMSYVGAFMQFIGQKETFEQMKQSGSLERGFQAIREGAEQHDLNWARVQRVFSDAYDSFEWTAPIESIKRIFAPFLRDVAAFGLLVLKTVAELVAEAFVIGFGPLGKEVWDKIKMMGKVIGLVLENPLGFAMNLLRAVARGIQGFGLRIFTHIKKGLLAWVLGPFAAMGVTLPDKLDIRGILNVLLQVLGLTYPQLKPRLIRKLNPHGELKVTAVEKLIEILNILRTEGMAGIWRKLLDYVENLQMTVVGAIRDWVIRAVVEAGIRKLVAWSNPAGALIDILFTIYKLIVFFVEKFQQIVSFASSVFESIGRIARGQLDEAANKVEETLAKTIPILISFLTSLLGLPDIAGAVRKLVTNLRARVEKAVDKVLDFVIGKVKKLIAKLIGKFKAKKGEPEAGLTMQGTGHTLKWEASGGRRRLMMHSSAPIETSAAKLEKDADEITQTCAPPHTTVTVPKLRNAARVLKTGEARETKLAGKPESQAAAPDQNQARAAEIAELTPLVEAATDPKIAATEAVASGKEDIDKQDPSQTVQPGATDTPAKKDITEVDMDDLDFRYVMVPEGNEIEAAWGPWQAMQGKRDTFKKEIAKEKLDGRYSVDLDHNPEYQILWRLGHLEYDDGQRDPGKEETPVGRILPTVSALYGNQDLASEKSRERMSSDQDRVMAIRFDVHRKIAESQTGIVDEFRKLTTLSAGQKAFVPLPGKQEELLGIDWAAKIETAAKQHQAQVVEAYEAIRKENFVSKKAVAAIARSGTAMLSDGMKILRGAKPRPRKVAAAAGFLGGIGMSPDPVDAELRTADYGKLDAEIKTHAAKFGSVFDKHHMIEESILAKLQELFTGADLLAALKAPGTPAAGVPVPGAALVEAAAGAIGKAIAKVPALAGTDTRAMAASMVEGIAPRPQTAFSAESTKQRGYAVVVLHQVNGLLGSQPASNVDAALATHLGPRLSSRAARLRARVEKGYAALALPAGGDPEAAKAALTAAGAQVGATLAEDLGAGFQADMKAALPGVIDQLSANAHSAFVQQYARSLTQTWPQNKGFAPGSAAAKVMADLEDRYAKGPGDLAKVQAQNRERWAKP